MVAQALKLDANSLPDPDWNALCRVSCSALLDGGRASGVRTLRFRRAYRQRADVLVHVLSDDDQ
jgi:hypothetical protein